MPCFTCEAVPGEDIEEVTMEALDASNWAKILLKSSNTCYSDHVWKMKRDST